MRVTLPTLTIGETKNLTFPFSVEAAGKTISSASVAASTYSGVDPSPSSLLSGAATFSGLHVTPKVTGGIAGATYLLFCTAQMTSGEAFICYGPLTISAPGVAAPTPAPVSPGGGGGGTGVQAYTANYISGAGQTTFTAPHAYAGGTVMVSLNGVEQEPTIDYTLPGGTSVVFTSGLLINDEVSIFVWV